ncbi:UPF0598 protein CG30010-like isoform X2 [Pomacea canaliculata]|uniref:UPF0598 protein CG30010-like isoform X2 n=1 Tax=Pomacea canaliculata TaxID=400727 RepID=UPI000D7318E5|nr:UPF0598 protein CG30010-like isoform X2 [Pomacea canaliculata]
MSSALSQKVNLYSGKKCFVALKRLLHYVQGQSPEPKIREYFYYIDHQGQLFLDDAKMKNFTSCFKEKEFLVFFFQHLKKNDTERYRTDFPYISLCGRERNYVRCEDRPIVFTHIIYAADAAETDRFSYAWAGDKLTVKFEPEKVCMLPETGRVYHPAPEKAGGVGLVRSSLANELSKEFDFLNGETLPPTHFTWKNIRYQLSNELYDTIRREV